MTGARAAEEQIGSCFGMMPVDDATYVSIQRHLYREAHTLDSRRFRVWLSFLAEDIRYIVSTTVARDASSGDRNCALIDEDLVGLKSRVDQLSNPRLTRAENPASLMRRVVSNIEAYETARADEIVVTSYLMAYRSRPGATPGGLYVAQRTDTLRRAGPSWLLAKRHVALDHAVMMEGVLSAFL